MTITDIKIRKHFEDGPMRAVVSITLDGCLAIHDIKVIQTADRLFIVMPSRKRADGTFRDIAHPIHADFRQQLEESVLQAYRQSLLEGEDGDDAE